MPERRDQGLHKISKVKPSKTHSEVYFTKTPGGSQFNQDETMLLNYYYKQKGN